MTSRQYPIGRFNPTTRSITASVRTGWIDDIASLPDRIRQEVGKLDEAGLDTPYRPGGWTRRQVVHHLADSHVNAYIRFRLALTEEEPTIRPYDEGSWAELEDARAGSVAVSLDLLSAIHERWVRLCRGLDAASFQRTLRHPDIGVLNLDWMLDQYAWHGRHHLAHLLL